MSLLEASPCANNISFWAEYLCLKPSIDQSYFAFVQETPDSSTFIRGTEKRYNNPFSFGSAWRAGVEFAIDQINDFHIEASYFRKTASRAVEGPFVSAVDFFPFNSNVGPGTVHSQNRFTWLAFDFLFGYRLFDCCPFSVYLEGGAHLVHLNGHRRTNVILAPFNSSTSFRDNNWGLGPELGAALAYQLPLYSRNHFLSFVAHARGALLVNRTHFKLANTLNNSLIPSTTQININNDVHYPIVPFGDFLVGVKYGLLPCRCPYILNIEIGYEFILYHRFVDWVHFDSGGSSFDNYSNFALHGPYVRAEVTF